MQTPADGTTRLGSGHGSAAQLSPRAEVEHEGDSDARMFGAVGAPQEFPMMTNRVSPGFALSTTYPVDVMAGDAFRQFFSTDVRGKTQLGFAAFFLEFALLPPERRTHKMWVTGEVMCVFGGLMLFFASTLVDLEANDNLGIAAASVGSLSVLMLLLALLFSIMPVVFIPSYADLASVFIGCKMLGFSCFFLNNATVFAFVAFVLNAVVKAKGALIGWIVCGMGVALFFALMVLTAFTLLAFIPIQQTYQEGWYLQAFAANIALSNYFMGRRSLREGADIQLAKILAGPILEDLRLVLEGGAKEV